VILVDTNVIMYAAGAEHPHKRPSVALLERIARGEIEATIDAEALQEILHRYRAIGRWEDGRRVFDLARRVFRTVVPVTAEMLDRARRILDTDRRIMARDALHAAVVMSERLEAVCSWDRDLDRIKGLVRREPDA
jgi:uncharacterized protein